jgi:hypothetical protein
MEVELFKDEEIEVRATRTAAEWVGMRARDGERCCKTIELVVYLSAGGRAEDERRTRGGRTIAFSPLSASGKTLLRSTSVDYSCSAFCLLPFISLNRLFPPNFLKKPFTSSLHLPSRYAVSCSAPSTSTHRARLSSAPFDGFEAEPARTQPANIALTPSSEP